MKKVKQSNFSTFIENQLTTLESNKILGGGLKVVGHREVYNPEGYLVSSHSIGTSIASTVIETIGNDTIDFSSLSIGGGKMGKQNKVIT